MSRGKYLSLEGARNSGDLDLFAAEHPVTGDSEALASLIGAMAAGKPPAAAGTSGAARSEGYSETPSQTDTSGHAS